MLNTSWYSLLDVLGHAPMNSRPGYTTFALQTHTFKWNLFPSVLMPTRHFVTMNGLTARPSPPSPSPSSASLAALMTRRTKYTNNIQDMMNMMLGFAFCSPMLHKSASNGNLHCVHFATPMSTKLSARTSTWTPHWNTVPCNIRRDHNNFPATVGRATTQQGDHDAMQQRRAE